MPSTYKATLEDLSQHHPPIRDPGGQEKVVKEVAKEEAKAKIRIVRLYRKRGAPHLVAKRMQTFVGSIRMTNVQTVTMRILACTEMQQVSKLSVRKEMYILLSKGQRDTSSF